MAAQPSPAQVVPIRPEHEKIRCPRCGGENARWSRRSGEFEKVIARMMLLRPFRCHDCRKRRYLFAPANLVVNPYSLRMVLWFILIFAIATVVVTRLMSRF